MNPWSLKAWKACASLALQEGRKVLAEWGDRLSLGFPFQNDRHIDNKMLSDIQIFDNFSV